MLVRAAELGIRHVDVAPTYGDGIAEGRLGEALAVLGRDTFVVSTKVGRLLAMPDRRRKIVHALVETVTGGRMGMQMTRRRAGRVLSMRSLRRAAPAAQPPAPDALGPVAAGQEDAAAGAAMTSFCDYSYDGVMRGLEGSLSRLATDRVDLVFIHDPDLHHRQAVRGAYRALDSLRRAGTIGAVGVAMNHTDPLVQFADEGDFDAFLIAGRYSLLDQSAAARLFPVATRRGIGIVAAGIFNGGILADPSPGAVFDYAPASDERLGEARLRKEVCDRHGVSIKAAALQLPFAHPAVTTVLLGATSDEELDESIELLESPIPPDLWSELKAQGLLAPDIPVPA